MDTTMALAILEQEDMFLIGKYRHAGRAFLKGQQPCVLEVPGLRSPDVGLALSLFRQFETDVPQREQKRWEIHIPRDPHFDEPDDGAIRKDGKDGKDDKLYFHYRPGIERLLGDRGIVLASWQQEWFHRMNRIWDACTEAHLAFAHRLDRLLPDGHELYRRALEGQSENCLRLLSYVPHRGTLAKRHTDRCAITFHIAESAPGLRTYQGAEYFDEEMPQLPNVLTFSGDQFARITGNRVPALVHSVEDMARGRYRRSAMVFFGKMYDEDLWPK